MGQNPPHVFRQKAQQFILNRRQMDLLIPDKYTPGGIVNFQITITKTALSSTPPLL